MKTNGKIFATTTTLVCGLLAAAMMSGVALAQGGDHRGPWPEAIAACKDKAAGADCSVAWRDRTMNGMCKASHRDAAVLVCRPKGPPPEMIEACTGKAEGAACTVTFGDHAKEGTCRIGHEGTGPLACHPQHHRPQP